MSCPFCTEYSVGGGGGGGGNTSSHPQGKISDALPSLLEVISGCRELFAVYFQHFNVRPSGARFFSIKLTTPKKHLCFNQCYFVFIRAILWYKAFQPQGWY